MLGSNSRGIAEQTEQSSRLDSSGDTLFRKTTLFPMPKNFHKRHRHCDDVDFPFFQGTSDMFENAIRLSLHEVYE